MKQIHVTENGFNNLSSLLKWLNHVPNVDLPDYFWERINETTMDMLGDSLVDKTVEIEDYYSVELIEDGETTTMIARDTSDEEWTIVI